MWHNISFNKLKNKDRRKIKTTSEVLWISILKRKMNKQGLKISMIVSV